MKNRCWTFFDKQDPSSLPKVPENIDHVLRRNNLSKEEEITHILMNQTMTALRMFVNDELNELDFALRNVTAEFLKPDVGTIIAIIHTVGFLYSFNGRVLFNHS